MGGLDDTQPDMYVSHRPPRVLLGRLHLGPDSCRDFHALDQLPLLEHRTGPHQASKRLAAATVCSRSSASRISASILRATGWTEEGRASRTFITLWTQSRCSRVSGHMSLSADQNPNAPSPTATTGARMPRP